MNVSDYKKENVRGKVKTTRGVGQENLPLLGLDTSLVTAD